MGLALKTHWLVSAFGVLCLVAAYGDMRPSVTVDRQKIDERVEPVPMVVPFTYEAKDGLLLRNGKPSYWSADGVTLGGVHSTIA